jgi:protein subunit release factor B
MSVAQDTLSEHRQNEVVSHVVVEPSHGIDAEGFADSLRRMYSAWGGQVDGEQGIHRLVQRSPLDVKQRRHTSFAVVSVDGESSDEHVRTYITFPYRLVKDHRTGRETDDVAGVLAGDLSLVRGTDHDPPAE